EQQLEQWQAWADAPWGRIRYAVVAETLARQLRSMTTGSALRVLDVGGGDGRDAIPLAMAGHQVTILDPAPSWLEAARQRAEQTGVRERVRVVDGSLDLLSAVGGGYDLVLCHFILHYRSELADYV